MPAYVRDNIKGAHSELPFRNSNAFLEENDEMGDNLAF
jgi:hypothetical protein